MARRVRRAREGLAGAMAPTILISNDDGFTAPGMAAMREALEGLGRLVVCCPDSEQSATSHALTLHRPLRIRKVEEDCYTVDGTPTDSVLLGINHILKGEKPALVMSGINSGPNLGDDIGYSGTVAAALEGTIYGVPSVAVSLASHDFRDFSAAKAAARRAAEWVLENGLPPEVTLNINIPAIEPAKIKGTKIAVQGKRHFEDIVHEKLDPRGRRYYWIGGSVVVPEQDPRSDIMLSREGWITVTPIRIELTAHDVLEHVKGLEE